MRKPAVWVHPKFKGKLFTSKYRTNRRKHDRSFELKEILPKGTKRRSAKFISKESWQDAVADGWKKVA